MATTSEVANSGIAATAASALDFDAILKRASDLGFTKGQLAALAGVDRTMLWRYSKGMVPPLEVATNLADGLGISMDEITGRGNPTPPPPSGPSTPPSPPGPRVGE